MDIKEWAFIAGLVLGSLAIVSVCWVWIQKQVLGAGGGVLSFFGVLLVGLSLWTSASVEVTPEGFRAEFERLEREVQQVAQKSQQIGQEVESVAQANNALSREVKVVAENLKVNKSQFLELTQTLQQRQLLDQQQLEQLNAPLQRLPEVDQRILDSSQLKLRDPSQ
ncbi:hypothetical protein Tel_09025 [Candidatus Tenderia electrophaga]|jgi:septal ring factor EnvC (AmiA/AmiB activator)|uniref:Uncharacterized protein n=1 Tax=Candidatus Tenderia electrophaga TaxID=1748243 RepID=A0A0S2TDP9_9GAMM|nr:hypothetical protein Tel_09025 [Candidatus Tenderia electrophaga]